MDEEIKTWIEHHLIQSDVSPKYALDLIIERMKIYQDDYMSARYIVLKKLAKSRLKDLMFLFRYVYDNNDLKVFRIYL